jgi:hypothetical protein
VCLWFFFTSLLSLPLSSYKQNSSVTLLIINSGEECDKVRDKKILRYLRFLFLSAVVALGWWKSRGKE